MLHAVVSHEQSPSSTPLVSSHGRRAGEEALGRWRLSDLRSQHLPSARSAAFLLYRVIVESAATLAQAAPSVANLSHGRAPVKLCVPARAEDGSRTSAVTTLGLVLDVTDDDGISLADVRRGAWEAIRFDPAFVARGAEDLRVARCVDALIDLARHLSIPTIGPDVRTSMWRLAFDYRMETFPPAAANDAVAP